MRNRVAHMLYRSLRRGDPLDHGWFEEALTSATRETEALDHVIWDAVLEILDEVAPTWREHDSPREARMRS